MKLTSEFVDSFHDLCRRHHLEELVVVPRELATSVLTDIGSSDDYGPLADELEDVLDEQPEGGKSFAPDEVREFLKAFAKSPAGVILQAGLEKRRRAHGEPKAGSDVYDELSAIERGYLFADLLAAAPGFSSETLDARYPCTDSESLDPISVARVLARRVLHLADSQTRNVRFFLDDVVQAVRQDWMTRSGTAPSFRSSSELERAFASIGNSLTFWYSVDPVPPETPSLPIDPD